ncbi:MAG: PspC domain-containing protein, partial [Actinomycetota bacterium]|nr:PspC domain-containing protein [Actinomycetota bacterium]
METVNDTNPSTDIPPYRQSGNRLTRSTDDKVVGGLAGGLGRYFGIDPVVFRIAFVVLTLAGGSGIVLYLVGWLMIPDDAGGNPLRRLGGERHQKLAAAVIAGLGV